MAAHINASLSVPAHNHVRRCTCPLLRRYQRREKAKRVRGLTQGSVCNWEVLVSSSPVINHAGPILLFDSSLQGLTFNTREPAPPPHTADKN